MSTADYDQDHEAHPRPPPRIEIENFLLRSNSNSTQTLAKDWTKLSNTCGILTEFYQKEKKQSKAKQMRGWRRVLEEQGINGALKDEQFSCENSQTQHQTATLPSFLRGGYVPVPVWGI